MKLANFLLIQGVLPSQCTNHVQNFVFVFHSIALTKIDVLDELEEIKVAVAYKIDGLELPSFPGTCFF